MIKLEVEDYCQKCSEFEPQIDKYTISTINSFETVDTFIYCEHRNRCKRIKEFIEDNKENINNEHQN